MDAALWVIRGLFAGYADGVFFSLNLQLALLNPRQFDDRQEVIALLEYIDGGKRTLACCLVLQPTAAGLCVKRTLEVQQHVNRVGKRSDHDCTRGGATMRNQR